METIEKPLDHKMYENILYDWFDTAKHPSFSLSKFASKQIPTNRDLIRTQNNNIKRN